MKLRWVCRGKIHGAIVTDIRFEYEGSIEVDKLLLEKAGIAPFEMVQVLNMANGERFETYAIPAARNSGRVSLNGAAARLGMKGDKIIILSQTLVSEDELKNLKPAIVKVNERNKP